MNQSKYTSHAINLWILQPPPCSSLSSSLPQRTCRSDPGGQGSSSSGSALRCLLWPCRTVLSLGGDDRSCSLLFLPSPKRTPLIESSTTQSKPHSASSVACSSWVMCAAQLTWGGAGSPVPGHRERGLESGGRRHRRPQGGHPRLWLASRNSYDLQSLWSQSLPFVARAGHCSPPHLPHPASRTTRLV